MRWGRKGGFQGAHMDQDAPWCQYNCHRPGPVDREYGTLEHVVRPRLANSLTLDNKWLLTKRAKRRIRQSIDVDVEVNTITVGS